MPTLREHLQASGFKTADPRTQEEYRAMAIELKQTNPTASRAANAIAETYNTQYPTLEKFRITNMESPRELVGVISTYYTTQGFSSSGNIASGFTFSDDERKFNVTVIPITKTEALISVLDPKAGE